MRRAIAAVLAFACGAAYADAAPTPAAGRCETVQSDRLVAGGPLRQAHAVELSRCGDEFRLALVKIDDTRKRDPVATKLLGRAAPGAAIELAGGACVLDGRPVDVNLAIHARWGKRKRIHFGDGLLDAWLPDEKAGAIRTLAKTEKLECRKDAP